MRMTNSNTCSEKSLEGCICPEGEEAIVGIVEEVDRGDAPRKNVNDSDRNQLVVDPISVMKRSETRMAGLAALNARKLNRIITNSYDLMYHF